MENSFILYTSYYDILSGLNDEKFGKLMRALFLYARGEKVENLPPDIRMAFSFITRDIDSNALKYNKKCEQMRENVKKRWAKGKEIENDTNVYNGIQMYENNTNDTNVYKRYKSIHNDDDNDIIKEEAKASKKKGKPFSAAAAAERDREEEEHEPLDPMFVDIQTYWNTRCKESSSTMRRLTIVTKNRQIAINQRLKEHGGDVAVIRQVIDNAMKSDVLNGRKGSGWVATFDWIMRPDNFANVLEGAYNDDNQQARPNAKKPINADAALDEAIKEAQEVSDDTPKAREEKERQRIRAYIASVKQSPNKMLTDILTSMKESGKLERLGIEWAPGA